MADGPHLLPAGTVLRFRSLEFVTTCNGYDMELLPVGANPDSPTPPPRRKRRSGRRARQVRMERRRAARLSSPAWVEAGLYQPSAVVEDVTTSPAPSAAPVPPKEGTTALSSFPFGMRSAAATYASSVNTNMSAYEDLLGHQLISICNLVASTPDDSYPKSADDAYLFVENVAAPEWNYSGVRNLNAFRSFQAARTTASHAPTTPARGITIPLGSASWSS
jgi:hypothetical protein